MAATEHKYSQRTFSTLSFCWHNRQTPTYRLRDYEFMECLGTEDHFPLSNLKVLIEQRRSSYGFWNGCGCAVFLSEINFAKAINCWYREQWNSMLLTTQSIPLKRAQNNWNFFLSSWSPSFGIITAERFCLQAQATGGNDIHNETYTLIKQQRIWASNQ